MSENIRIRTSTDGTDKYLSLKIEQDFDFIEILSLKISQDQAYSEFCSDYGVIAGRVTVNNGFGVPNAKVSVFIPISDTDKEDKEIYGLYPYETPNDKNSDGIRYNLLPMESDSQDDCYTPVGTFPAKREILDNEVVSEVYCKYYKFTTQTNFAGDFMIFGVPVGNHTVHIDADLSNIGIVSQRPYDLIEQGAPQKMFYSPTKFKESTNLNTLPQVKSANIGVNVRPFWGNLETCQIGINRVDFNLDYFVKPAAIFMGSYFGDSRKNSINKRCRPRKGLGRLCEQVTGEGSLEMIRKTTDNEIEEFSVDGGRVIDQNGTWSYQIPMNLDYVVTDEFGNIVPSGDENIGIPTRARVRFRVGMDESGGGGRLRTRGKYLIPHNPNNLNDIDFSFDKTTKDTSFTDLYWNKIYTVKNFIPRVQRAGLGRKNKHYMGIKNVDDCAGDKTPFPFNRTYVKGNILFTIICFIVTIIASIVAFINFILCKIRDIKIAGWKPFKWITPITLKCPSDPETYYAPGCDGEPVENYTDCISAVLAEQLGLYQFDFFNDWVNGTLYMYLLKYKKRRRGREKFCETYCRDYQGGTGYNSCKTNQISDTTVFSVDDNFTHRFRNGLLVKYDGNLYYPPLVLDGSGRKMFATDLTNLGSVFDCDWQGFPKIIQYITNTSYKIPPLIQEEPEPGDDEGNITTGMFQIGNLYVGLFFDIGCINAVTFNSGQATNIRRLCELSVDIPESEINQPVHRFVTIEEIYDPQDPADVLTSTNRYVRDTYALLNVAGSGINSYPPIVTANLDVPQNGSSFNIQGDSGALHVNGSLYNSFRNFRLSPSSNSDMGSLTSNSFYMYFGIIPEKSAIEKTKAKYFTTCNPAIVDEYIIDTTVTNTTVVGASNGSIAFTFIGGTSPFVYTWTGPNYSFGPQTATTSGNITGLIAGEYTITSTDALGTVVIKKVSIDGPLGLSCSFGLFQEPRNQSTNDGMVSFTINGGTPPYTVRTTNSLGVSTSTYATATNGTLQNIPAGLNTFVVTDSSNPIQTCNTQLTATTAPPLVLSIPSANIQNVSCDETNDGSIAPLVSGGTPSYTVTVTGPNGYSANQRYPGNGFVDLFDGVYTVTATDSVGQTQTQNVTIIKIVPPTVNSVGYNNAKQCDPTRYTINFNIVAGTYGPPFKITYTIDGVVSTGYANTAGQQTFTYGPIINGLLQISAQDTIEECNSNTLTLPISVIKRPTSSLAGSYTILSVGGTPPFATYVIRYNATGGLPPYTYSPVNTGAFDQKTFGSGTHSAIVTDSVGCTDIIPIILP